LETVSSILYKAQEHFGNRLPFVLYCKPGQNMITGIFQKNNTLHLAKEFNETGFIFSSFEGQKYLLIPEYESEILYAVLAGANGMQAEIPTPDMDSNAKDEFERLVKSGIDAIEAGLFSKVVMSRTEMISVPDFDFKTVFEKLLYTYPTAFRYCWFHPESEMWMGATPEQLLKFKDKEFNTVALAGTQKVENSESVVWPEKERQEQQFVTDFISNSLKDEVSEMTLSEPYTIKAGSLLHIKTDIVGKLKDDAGLKQVVEILHPTPAVCGLPKAEAKLFILEHEGYDREFYSGFLGELNKDFATDKNTSEFFVNLRCMKITDQTANLYVGCGITKDSIPEKEFIETVNKSMTMKKILL
jgi:isochorismate synthase